MQQKPHAKKTTTVREHPRKVPPSKKNPAGITIVDQHKRRIPGSSLCRDEVLDLAKNYELEGVIMPSSGKLAEFSKADDYDKTIGIWTDYFNKKFNTENPLDPDMVKALIASESSFNPEARSGVAYGLTQITKQTLKILQDGEGEAKDFTFCKMRLKDLDNPDLAIPMAVRWLFKKKEMAERKLKKPATHEDIITEYKGLTRSKSDYKEAGLQNYRKNYEKLKKK